MGSYTKEDVTFHREGFYGQGHPAVNVKVRSFGPEIDEIVRAHGCTETEAQAALDFAWEGAHYDFWEHLAPHALEETWGKDSGLEIVSEGRSSGWCTVHGLPDFAFWDAVALAKWRSFEQRIQAEVAYLRGEWAKGEIAYYLNDVRVPAQLPLFEVHA